jgi:hypothetical protein
MVRAIRDGRKTMTRRVMKPQPKLNRGAGGQDCTERYNWKGIGTAVAVCCGTWVNPETLALCPYGQPGDRPWVRETFRCGSEYWKPGGNWKTGAAAEIHYTADDKRVNAECNREQLIWWHKHRKPGFMQSIFMPRWASRITLEIVSVRVQRLQDISEADAQAEGVVGALVSEAGEHCAFVPAFAVLWDSINLDRGHGWARNDWVWAVEFKRIETKGTP